MKYLKLFEEFNNYNPKSNGISIISEKRSKGSVNWFTRDEINSIRERAKQLGVPRVMSQSRGINQSFFGNARGVGGLKESVDNFFKKGDKLCNEVSIMTKSGNYRIIKRGGEFTLNGKNSGGDISSVLSMML